MKYFSYLFCLYFLALSSMPCLDIHEAHLADKLQVTQISDAGHDKCDHQKHADLCSPFCVCSCCGISQLVAGPMRLVMTFAIIETVTNRNSFLHVEIWQGDCFSSVFRPPQV
jgi:hypothetical protein